MISIFEVTGPVMIGPSSSHTAGAARLARVAAALAPEPFSHVSFGLHGSFFDTYLGHGTDKALLAGVLGISEDDEAIRDAEARAEEAGITCDYHHVTLEDVHENSVQITFRLRSGGEFQVIGSSIGGGQIEISRVGEFEASFSATLPTLFVEHLDRRGMISEISRVISDAGVNIGVLRHSRRTRGGYASTVAETDDPLDQAVVEAIAKLPDVYHARAVNLCV